MVVLWPGDGLSCRVGHRRGCAPRPCPGLSVRALSARARVCAGARVCVPVTGRVHVCVHLPSPLWSSCARRPLEPPPLAEALPGPWGSGASRASSRGAFRGGRSAPRCPARPPPSRGARQPCLSAWVQTVSTQCGRRLGGLGVAILLSVLRSHLLVGPFISPFLLSFGLVPRSSRVPFETVDWRLASHEGSSWQLWVSSLPASGRHPAPSRAMWTRWDRVGFRAACAAICLHWGLQPAGYSCCKL